MDTWMVTDGIGRADRASCMIRGDLNVMMQRKRAIADDVDVHLVELAEAALLWALAAPDLLDLVALEGKWRMPALSRT